MGDDDVSRRQRSFDGKHLERGGVELRWSGRDDEAHLVVGALLDDVEQGTMHVLLLVLLGDLRPSLSNRSQFFQNLLANRRIRHTELS